MNPTDKESIEQLIQQIAYKDTPNAAYKQLLAMGEIVIPFVAKIINDPQQPNHKRYAGLNLLGKINDVQALPFLLVALKDKNSNIRRIAANALSRLKYSEANIPDLIEAFANEDKEVRSRIVSILGKLAADGITNPEVVTFLISALRDRSQLVREQAAMVLGNSGDKSAIIPLIRILSESEPVCLLAAQALGSLKAEQAVAPLINMFQYRAGHTTFQQTILISLGMIGGPDGYAFVFDKLKDLNKKIRESAIQAMGLFGNPEAFETLFEISKTEEIYLAAQAVKSLGQLGDKRALEPLLNLLNSDNWFFQLSAVKGLGDLKDLAAFESLMYFLQNDKRELRFQAAIALGKLGDKRALALLTQLAQTGHTESSLTQATPISVVAAEAIAQIEKLNS